MSLGKSLSRKIPFTASIYTAELSAILYGLKYINEIEPPKCLIITDSLSAVMGMKQIYPSHPILIYIKAEIHTIAQKGITLGVLWVPSHTGIEGNEKADILTKAAISSPESVNIEETVHLDLKSYIKSVMQN